MILALALAPAAIALPRDAAAVLNRCGIPLRGDEIVLDNSVAGGHRTLKYERGTLVFDRFANDGWSFSYGAHGKRKNLNAEQMDVFMPCLKDALADSALPEPFKTITPLKRVEVSAKRSYRTLVLVVLAALVVIGLILYLLSLRRKDEAEADD